MYGYLSLILLDEIDGEKNVGRKTFAVHLIGEVLGAEAENDGGDGRPCDEERKKKLHRLNVAGCRLCASVYRALLVCVCVN